MRMLVTLGSMALLVMACSSSSTGSSGGGSNSGKTVGDQCDTLSAAYCSHAIDECKYTPGASTNGTVGDQCNQVATAICNRETACGQTVTDCVTSFVNACCTTRNLCGSPAASTTSAITACTTAINAEACADISAQTTPTECNSVIEAGFPSTVADCTVQAKASCCGDASTCAKTATSVAADINTCVNDIHAASCTQATALPSTCSGVVKYTGAPIDIASHVVSIGGLGGFVAAPALVR